MADAREQYTIVGGDIKPKSRPRVKKRCLIAVIVVVIACACIGFGFRYGLFGKGERKEELDPANPVKALPASPSKLRRFRNAAVCADGAACAEIGNSILQQNGSAVDAAIATMFCNGVFTMQSMGLGGGFLMTIFVRESNRAYSLNARETAPLGTAPELYEENRTASRYGPLSIGVPGELRGYKAAHDRFGRLEWARLIEPTIRLCEGGFEMSKHQHESFAKSKMDKSDANFREWFLEEDGSFKKRGSKIVPKKLCETLRLIAKNGADDLYNGTLSQMLVEDLREMGSIITEEDLQQYQPQWMDPITVELRHKETLYSVPPPGSGAVLGFIMNILDGFRLKPRDIEGIENTVQTYHKIIEAFKFAFAERTALGDMSFVNISDIVSNLTSPKYAEMTRNKIRENFTSEDPGYYGAVYYTKSDSGTAHISVLAGNGDAVSVTSSINLYFGSGRTSKQTGIILNSSMDDFSLPNFSNYFNLMGSPNNEMKPGKRPLSSMSPTIVVDENGDVKMVIGASGGTKITTSIALFSSMPELQVLTRTLWLGQNIKEAIDAPRFHHQLQPMEVQYEYGTLQQIVDGLEALGHETKRYRDSGSIICALMKASDHIYANADYRKGGDVYGI